MKKIAIKLHNRYWIEYGFSVYEGRVKGFTDDGRIVCRINLGFGGGHITCCVNNYQILDRIPDTWVDKFKKKFNFF